MNRILGESNTAFEDTIREISDVSTYSYDTLSALPHDVLKLICHQFIADNGITQKTYGIIQSALMASIMPKIADLADVPLSSVAGLPFETKEIICGMYLMEYSEDSDNHELAVNIRQRKGDNKMNVYGNTYWQKATDNQNISVVFMQEPVFENVRQSLEKSGLNYCAYEKNGAVKMAVNDSDLGKINAIMKDVSEVIKITKSTVPYTPPPKNIFGNTEYKDISEKRYFTSNADMILKIADMMEKQGIKFSGRVYSPDRATITVTSDDLQKVKSLHEELANMRNGSHHKVFEMPKQEIIGTIPYKNIRSKSIVFTNYTAEDYRAIQPILDNYNVPYSGVIRNDKVTFSVEEENRSNFIMAVNSSVAEINIRTEMENLGLSDEQISIFGDTIRLSAQNDVSYIMKNYLKPYYTKEQLTEMSGYITEYAKTVNNEGFYANNEAFRKIVNAGYEFDMQHMLAETTSHKHFNTEQMAAYETALRSGLDEVFLKEIDNSFSVSEIEEYTDLCLNSTEYSNIRNFLVNHSEQAEERSKILRSYLTTENGIAEVLEHYFESSLSKNVTEETDRHIKDSEPFKNISLPDVDGNFDLEINLEKDGIYFSFAQMPDVRVHYSLGQVNKITRQVEENMKSEVRQ